MTARSRQTAPRRGQRPRGGRPAPARRRTRGQQRWTAVVAAVIVLAVALVVFVGVRAAGSNDYEGTGNGQVQLVRVEEGQSMSELGPHLVELGVVKSEEAFESAAYLAPGASSLMPGFYRLEEEMSAEAAVEALMNPDNQVDLLQVQGGSTLKDVTVVGGDTRNGIFTQISELSCAENQDDCLDVEDLENAAANADPKALKVPEWARDAVEDHKGDERRLEGLIVPGDYIIDPKMDAEEVLAELIGNSAEHFEKLDVVSRSKAVGLEPYELLTAASLVEREAPAGEFDKVARVILNRLDEGMRLEFDSTVNYGLEEQEVATTDEDRERETPWNTYAKEGLPETPIASASDDAITAVENPAEGDWLFFVTIDQDGTTVFNDTFEEHQQDVIEALENGVFDTNRAEPGGEESGAGEDEE